MLKKGKYFPRGIHVHDMKYLSKNSPIEVLPEPEEVSICLAQHIGSPASSIVQVGDKVRKGQLIAEATGPISANIYASLTGTVISIDDFPTAMGVMQKHIVIRKAEQGDTEFGEYEMTLPPLEVMNKETIINRIREAGIVGLGGAGFPTAVKVSPKNQLEYLIINGAECEPYLTCDYRLMLERTEELRRGIELFKIALNVKKVMVGIEANKPDVIEKFAKFTDFDTVVLRKQYPVGSEKHLIYACTGRKVPIGKLPSDVGCCVQNIKTVLATYDAVYNNIPLYKTVITVTGEAVKNPKNLVVPVGTSYDYIIDYCGGMSDETAKVLAGGPMMGKALISTAMPVKKADSGLVLLLEDETSSSQPTNCIHCGVCALNCPMKLEPMMIDFYTLAGDYKTAAKYGARNCIECGSCAYNCPAKRALVQSISLCKAKLREVK